MATPQSTTMDCKRELPAEASLPDEGPANSSSELWLGGVAGNVKPATPTRIPRPVSATPMGSSRKPRRDSPMPRSRTYSMLPLSMSRSVLPRPSTPSATLYCPSPSPVPSWRTPSPYEIQRPIGPLQHLNPDFVPRLPPRLAPRRVTDDGPVNPEHVRHIMEILRPGWVNEQQNGEVTSTVTSRRSSRSFFSGKPHLPKSVSFRKLSDSAVMTTKNLFKSRKADKEPAVSDGGFQAKLPDVTPQDYEDPKNVFESMPSPYWTGRFMGLRDKMRNEEDAPKPELIQGDSKSWADSEWSADYSMALKVHRELRKCCKTEEALKSFWHYQQHFASQYNMPSLVAKFEPDNDKPWIPRERLPASATTTNVTVNREAPTSIPRAVRSVTNLMGKLMPDKKDGAGKKKENTNPRPPWR